MNNERVTPKNAAKELQMDVITLRELMKREKLPIGYTEIEKIRKNNETIEKAKRLRDSHDGKIRGFQADKLRFSEDIPYDAEMLAEASGFALQIVTQALQQFSKLQLVVTESDGTLFLPKSLKMIGSESASAQRVREYREREKNKTKPTETPENAECNERVTESNVNVQKGNIEKELEKELEKENKKGGKRETTQSIFERLLPEYTISDVMADKLREWFKYKTERKDGYKEQGMKSLLKQVANKVSVYGDTAVCNLIDECMSNGWKGIIWDKLQSSSAYRNSGDRIGNRVKDVDGW